MQIIFGFTFVNVSSPLVSILLFIKIDFAFVCEFFKDSIACFSIILGIDTSDFN